MKVLTQFGHVSTLTLVSDEGFILVTVEFRIYVQLHSLFFTMYQSINRVIYDVDVCVNKKSMQDAHNGTTYVLGNVVCCRIAVELSLLIGIKHYASTEKFRKI